MDVVLDLNCQFGVGVSSLSCVKSFISMLMCHPIAIWVPYQLPQEGVHVTINHGVLGNSHVEMVQEDHTSTNSSQC